jgi:hypothetical protein
MPKRPSPSTANQQAERRSFVLNSLKWNSARLEKLVATVPVTWEQRDHQSLEARFYLWVMFDRLAGLFPSGDELGESILNASRLYLEIVDRSPSEEKESTDEN